MFMNEFRDTMNTGNIVSPCVQFTVKASYYLCLRRRCHVKLLLCCDSQVLEW